MVVSLLVAPTDVEIAAMQQKRAANINEDLGNVRYPLAFVMCSLRNTKNASEKPKAPVESGSLEV
jgi:hypothetical protein